MINVAVPPSRIPDLLDNLEKDVYNKIPESKCLGCPVNGGKGGRITAECCKKASPPMYFIEFMYVYNHIQVSWSKDKRKQLIFGAFRDILNPSREKPCLLLDNDTNRCGVYKARWSNCRTYGMISETEWESRGRAWIKELLSEKITKEGKEIIKVKSPISGIGGKVIYNDQEIDAILPDTEKIDTYVEDLFKDGFNAESINNKLEADYGIQKAVYDQCRNIEVESLNFDLDSVNLKLAEIESKLVGKDITKDPENPSYMQFHVYLLHFILGEKKVKTLIQCREIWTDEEKEHFLEQIKGNLNDLVSIKL